MQSRPACQVPGLRAQWARRYLATVLGLTGDDTRPEDQAGRKQTSGGWEGEARVSAKAKLSASTGIVTLSPVPSKSLENRKHRGDLSVGVGLQGCVLTTQSFNIY